jgi:iron complex outermembrane receptor protein
MTTLYRKRLRPWAPLLAIAAGLFASTALAQLVAPKVQSEPAIEYPQGVDAGDVDVTVTITLDDTGVVKDAVEKARTPIDAPQVFADRAVAFARALKFAPATKDGAAIPARIDYHVRFIATKPAASVSAPVSAAVSASVSAPVPASVSASASAAPSIAVAPAGNDNEPIELDVHGHKTEPPRAASDFDLDKEVLQITPHQGAGDLLNEAPGVYVGHIEGDAVANNIFLRGFDADHGQDIEFRLGSMPLNAPSHIHGQGYTDLNFIIPEVVRSIRVIEGVFDPRQGDFAVAGSAYYDLGVADRGYLMKGTLGSFGTRRLSFVWAPKDEADETFGAVSIRHSDGFGNGNRTSDSASAMGQYAFDLPAGYRMLFTAATYVARGKFAGAIRRDDYLAGRIGFFDSYAFPSATAQSASNTRSQIGIEIDRVTENGAHLEFATWLMFTTFRLRENFTGFAVAELPAGNGDLIEQANADTSLGAVARYRSRRYKISEDLSLLLEPGMTFRTSSIDQSHAYVTPGEFHPLLTVADAAIRQTDLGGYLDLDLRLAKKLRIAGGVRADVLAFDVDERVSATRRTAQGVAWGPRVGMQLEVTDWFHPFVSYGEGFRSPNALAVVDGQKTPFTKVRTLEGGTRLRFMDDRLVLSAAVFGTFMSDDLSFEAESGRLERSGPTTRVGSVLAATAKPWKWLLGTASATFVKTTLDDPPQGDPGEPPALRKGDPVPFVPNVIMRASVGVQGALTKVGSASLTGRFGVAASFLGPRPLPYGQTAKGFGLLDVSGGVRLRELELGLDVINLLDKRYADTELVFPSRWNTASLTSSAPARHFVPGAPRTILASLTVHL